MHVEKPLLLNTKHSLLFQNPPDPVIIHNSRSYASSVATDTVMYQHRIGMYLSNNEEPDGSVDNLMEEEGVEGEGAECEEEIIETGREMEEELVEDAEELKGKRKQNKRSKYRGLKHSISEEALLLKDDELEVKEDAHSHQELISLDSRIPAAVKGTIHSDITGGTTAVTTANLHPAQHQEGLPQEGGPWQQASDVTLQEHLLDTGYVKSACVPDYCLDGGDIQCFSVAAGNTSGSSGYVFAPQMDVQSNGSSISSGCIRNENRLQTCLHSPNRGSSEYISMGIPGSIIRKEDDVVSGYVIAPPNGMECTPSQTHAALNADCSSGMSQELQHEDSKFGLPASHEAVEMDNALWPTLDKLRTSLDYTGMDSKETSFHSSASLLSNSEKSAKLKDSDSSSETSSSVFTDDLSTAMNVDWGDKTGCNTEGDLPKSTGCTQARGTSEEGYYSGVDFNYPAASKHINFGNGSNYENISSDLDKVEFGFEQSV